jgi:integrase
MVLSPRSPVLIASLHIPPLEVARILGHSSVTTTLTIYAHAIEEQTSPRAAQIMDEALRRQDP